MDEEMLLLIKHEIKRIALPASDSARTRALDNAGEVIVKSPILMFA